MEAQRIDVELFDAYVRKSDSAVNSLGLAVIRDGHGANAFGNLIRYRIDAERGAVRGTVHEGVECRLTPWA